ncbi:hypothetical protein B7463_g55, partial [Scytalidium lignicola]
MSYPLEGRDLKSITDEELVDTWHASKRQASNRGSFDDDCLHVVQITSTAIMKMNMSVEAEIVNMEEVLKKSSVPVPRLYRSGSARQLEYIITEYIDGERLDRIGWETRTERERQHIKAEIKKAFISLSNIRGTVPGPVKNIAQGRLFSVYGAHTKFSTVRELEELLTAKLFGKGSLIGAFDQLVMCHMDLNMRNLIFDKNNRLFFLDWADSGYYPPESQEALLLHDIQLTHPDSAWEQDLLEVHRELYGSGNEEVVAKLIRVIQNNNGPRGASHLVNDKQSAGEPTFVPRKS